MLLSVQHIVDATPILSQIINEHRAMPQRGKFRLARMHAKLLPEFNLAHAQRDEMITAYGVHETIELTDPETGAVSIVETPKFVVPPDKMPEFNAAWKAIADELLEVDVAPIPLADLDSGGGNGEIEAHELIVLGDLVGE